jgi:hypothetical protein
VREAQERLDAQEFAEWKAYYRVCPWGDDWAQADLIAAMLYRGSSSIEPGAFMPTQYGIGCTKDATAAATAQDVAAKLDQWAHMNGLTHGR